MNIISFITAFLILYVDLRTPLGVAGGVPYVALVLLASFYEKKNVILFFALVSTALTLLGLYFSPNGGEIFTVHINRIYALLAIWSTAVMLLLIRKKRLLLAREIEARKKAELDLKKSLTQLEGANKAKSAFLSSMSHELRTPLNAILGFSQVLLMKDKSNQINAQQTGQVECILQAGNHLLELVNEILDLSRIEADKLIVDIREVDCGMVTGEVVTLVQPIADRQNISIINHFDSHASSALLTDERLLKQCLLNLISNAVKYNGEGGTVTISGEKTEDDYFKISVEDTGIGIAEEEFDGIFGMFHRIDENPEIYKEGAGIGLMITKKIIAKMAGRIGFESQKDVGSVFWIELPLSTNQSVLIWSDAIKIGVDQIDEDHHILVNLLNEASNPHIEVKRLNAVVDDLIAYTHYHFVREEAIMEVCNFPNLADHRKYHEKLLQQVESRSNIWRKSNDSDALAELSRFLRKWLLQHILNEDTDIATCTMGKDKVIREALSDLQLDSPFLLET